MLNIWNKKSNSEARTRVCSTLAWALRLRRLQEKCAQIPLGWFSQKWEWEEWRPSRCRLFSEPSFPSASRHDGSEAVTLLIRSVVHSWSWAVVCPLSIQMFWIDRTIFLVKPVWSKHSNIKTRLTSSAIGLHVALDRETLQQVVMNSMVCACKPSLNGAAASTHVKIRTKFVTDLHTTDNVFTGAHYEVCTVKLHEFYCVQIHHLNTLHWCCW